MKQDVEFEMVGVAALVTTESFNNNNAALYPLFNSQNKVIGSQIIFSCIDSVN